jgi:dipeptidyl aminopeptidase/acylaminoacyl peptidase
MKGLDFILDENTFLDKKRVVLLGASYGGYMANWVNVRINIDLIMLGSF